MIIIKILSWFRLITISLLFILILVACGGKNDSTTLEDLPETALSESIQKQPSSKKLIQPSINKPYYWEYQAQPILLIGGENDDGLFQWPIDEMVAHLDLLQSSGGNYIRNVLNHAHNNLSGLDQNDVMPHAKTEKGYDLNIFNPEYFQRLERLLTEARKRDIIVQLTFWEAFDFIDGNLSGKLGNFYFRYDKLSWNPKNNINYSAEESGIPTTNTTIATWEKEWKNIGFHYTIPGMSNDNAMVRGYQEKFIRRVLDSTLKYDNVLYNVQNERQWIIPIEWANYWVTFASDYAKSQGKTIYVTDMADKYYMTQPQQQEALQSNTDFFEISQVNQLGGQTQYNEIIYAREQLKNRKKPINAVKIYRSSKEAEAKGRYDDEDKMWRLVFGGAAAVRFHRPTPPSSSAKNHGFGLTPEGQKQIKSVRMFADGVNLFDMVPNNARLSQRSSNEAYLLENPEREYAIYFTGRDDATVQLDLRKSPETFQIDWLDVRNNQWNRSDVTVYGGEKITISAPKNSQYVAVLRSQE